MSSRIRSIQAKLVQASQRPADADADRVVRDRGRGRDRVPVAEQQDQQEEPADSRQQQPDVESERSAAQLAQPCPPAAASVFAMSIAIVIGPTPPGTGVIAPATGSTSSEVDVSAQSVVGAVDPDVDHGRPGLHVLGGDQLRHPDRGDQDIGPAADGGQIPGAGVADRDGGVTAQQQADQRPPDQVRPADDHGVGAFQLGSGVIQQLHHPGGRAGHQSRPCRRPAVRRWSR